MSKPHLKPRRKVDIFDGDDIEAQKEREKMNEQVQTTIEDYVQTKYKIMKTKAQAEEKKRLIQRLRDKVQELQGELDQKISEQSRIYSMFNIPETGNINALKNTAQQLQSSKQTLEKIATTLGIPMTKEKDIENTVNQLNKTMNEVKSLTNSNMFTAPQTIKELQYINDQNSKDLVALSNILDMNNTNATFYDVQQEVANIVANNKKLNTKVKQQEKQFQELADKSEAGINKLVREKKALIDNQNDLCQLVHSKNADELKNSIQNLVENNNKNDKTLSVLSHTLECNKNDVQKVVSDLVQHARRAKRNLSGIYMQLNSNEENAIKDIVNLQENNRQLVQNNASQTETIKYLQHEKENHEHTIADQKVQIRHLEGDSVDKDNEIARHVALIKVREAEISQCRAQLKQRDAEISKHTNSLNQSGFELEQKDQQIEQYEEEIQHLKKSLKESDELLGKKDNDLKEMTFELEDITAQLEELKDKLSQKDSEIKNAKSDLKQKENDIKTAQSNIVALNNQLSEAMKQKAEQIEDLQIGFDQERRRMINELSNCKQDFMQYKRETQSQLETLTDALNKVESESQIAVERSKAKTEEANNIRNELQQKNNEIRTKEDQIDELESNLSKIKLDLENSKTDLKSKQSENTKLQTTLKDLRETLEAREKELAQKDQTVQKLKMDLQDMQETARKRAEELDAKEDDYYHLQDQLSKLEVSLEKGGKKNVALQEAAKTIANLTQQLSEANDILDRREAEAKAKVAEIELVLKEKETALKRSTDEGKQLNNKLSMLNQEIGTLQQELEAERVKNSAVTKSEAKLNESLKKEQKNKRILAETNEGMSARIQVLEEDIYEKSARITALMKSEAKANEQNLKEKTENQNLKERIAELEAQIESANEENTNQAKRITLLSNSEMELKNKLAKESREKQILESQFSDISLRHENISKEHLDMTERLETLEKSEAKLKSDLAAETKEKNDIINALEQAEDDLEIANAKIEALNAKISTMQKNEQKQNALFNEQKQTTLTQIEAAQEELATSKQHITALEEAVEQQKDQIASLRKSEQSLSEQIAKERRENISLNAQITESNSIQSQQQEEITSLNNEIEQQKALLNASKKNEVKLNEIISSEKREKEELQNKIDDLEVQIGALSKNTQLAETISKEQKEKLELRRRIIELECELDKARTENITIGTELEEHKILLENKNKSESKLKDEAAKLKEESLKTKANEDAIEELKLINEQLNEKLNKEMNEKANIKETAEKLKEEAEKLKEKEAKLEEENALLNNKLSKENAEKEKLREKTLELNRQISQKHEALLSQETDTLSLNAAIEEQKSMVKALQKNELLLKEQISKEQKEKAEIKSEYEERIDQLNQQNQSLNNAVNLDKQLINDKERLLESICKAMNIETEYKGPEDIIREVKKVTQGYTKVQSEVCKALSLPPKSPIKDISREIDNLKSRTDELSKNEEEISSILLVDDDEDVPGAVKQKIDELQDQIRHYKTDLNKIATSMGTKADPQEILRKMRDLEEENEGLSRKIDRFSAANDKLCGVFKCKPEQLEEAADRIATNLKRMQRFQQRLSALVGVDSNDDSDVVYQRVQDLSNETRELSRIVGEDNLKGSIASIVKEKEELKNLVGKDNIVDAFNEQRNRLEEAEERIYELESQQQQLARSLGAGSFNELQKSVTSIMKENSRLRKEQTEVTELREQLSMLVDDEDEGELRIESLEDAVTVVSQMKASRDKLQRESEQTATMLASSLGIKTKNPTAINKAICKLRAQNEQMEERQAALSKSYQSICDSLGVHYDTDPQSIKELIDSNNSVAETISDAFGIPKNQLNPSRIVRAVKELSEQAARTELIRKQVANIEKEHRKITEDIEKQKEKDLIEAESALQKQIMKRQEADDELRRTNRELATITASAESMRGTINDIVEAFGPTVRTPSEVVREITRLRTLVSDLSRRLNETERERTNPVVSSALPLSQQAQLRMLRDATDRVHSNARQISNQFRTPQVSRSNIRSYRNNDSPY